MSAENTTSRWVCHGTANTAPLIDLCACLLHLHTMSYFGVPRMARRRAGRGHGGEDVRLSEGSKALLPLGLRVRTDGSAEQTLLEQDEGGAEGLGVELVGEGKVGEISAVTDEEWLFGVNKLRLHGGCTVLKRKK